MKFFFLLMFDGLTESGVNKKIFSQVQLLNDLGVDAKLILIGDTSRTDIDLNFVIREQIAGGIRDPVITRIIRSRKIAGIIRDRIQNLGPSDILYIRYPLILLFCPINLFKPFRKCKLIFEHNTLLRSEYIIAHKYLYLLFEIFFGNVVLCQADGGIGVTNEITDFQMKKLGGKNKPFMTISNGIDVISIPLRSPPCFVSEQEISMICVANFSRWHGVDRLILGLARYSGKSLITIHLIGEGIEIPNLKRLCTENNISDRVKFHGFLSGSKLDRLFDESHIAIGELGIHRKKMSESSTLKSREYCSRGIPYIISSLDPDFPNDFPYILKIPADDTFIDIEKVITFTSHIYRDTNHPRKMRQYAFEHLDWSIKMKDLKMFLEDRIINN